MDTGKRVKLSDGDYLTGDFGTELIGDATKTLDVLAGGTAGSGRGKGLWLVTAKASSASIFGDVPIGHPFPADGDEVPAVGDKAKFGTFASVAELISGEIEVSADEVDMAVLDDEFDPAEPGKKKFSGKLSMQYIIGKSDIVGGAVNRYFDLIRKTASGVSFSVASNAAVYLLAYVRKTSVDGEANVFFFGKVHRFGMKLGAARDGRQSFDEKIRLAPTLDGDAKPCFFVWDNVAE